MLAKGSVWGLRGLLVLTLVSMSGLFALGIVLKIRADWSWAEAGKAALALLIVAVVGGFIYGMIWLLIKWYEWAKRYVRDC